MAGKKKCKKKKKSKKEKKDGDDSDEKVEDKDIVNMVYYGWIRVKFTLCNAISEKYNSFTCIMRADERVLEMKKRIVDFHGRVEQISLYDQDPLTKRKYDKP